MSLLVVCAAVGRWAAPVSAAPTGLTVNGGATATAGIGQTVQLIATYNDDGAGSTAFTLTSSALPAVGTFFTGSAVVGGANDNHDQTVTLTNTVVTVAEDVDATVEVTTLTVSFQCLSAGTSTFTPAQAGGIGTATAVTVTCGTTALSATPGTTTQGIPSVISGTCLSAGAILNATSGGVFNTSGITNGAWTDASDITCAAPGTVTAQFDCNTTTTVTFTLSGNTGTTLACTGTGVGNVGLVVTPATNVIGGLSVVSGTWTAAGQQLTASVTGFNVTSISNGVWVSGSQINCVAAGAISANFTCGYAVNVTFGLNGLVGYLNCGSYTGYPTYPTYPQYPNYNTGTYPYNQYPYGTTNPLVTAGVASNLTVSANPQSLNCNSTSTLTVQVRDANGNNVANGATVMLTTTGGNLSPTQTTTNNGTATVNFLAPSSSSNITVTAASGTALNSTNLNVTCAAAAPVVSSAPVLPPSIPAAPVTAPRATGVINPPNTGDAGLASLSSIWTSATDAFAW